MFSASTYTLDVFDNKRATHANVQAVYDAFRFRYIKRPEIIVLSPDAYHDLMSEATPMMTVKPDEYMGMKPIVDVQLKPGEWRLRISEELVEKLNMEA